MSNNKPQPKQVIIAATVITMVLLAAFVVAVIAGMIALIRWIF